MTQGKLVAGVAGVMVSGPWRRREISIEGDGMDPRVAKVISEPWLVLGGPLLGLDDTMGLK